MNDLPIVELIDNGLIAYESAWEQQTILHKQLIQNKLEARKLSPNIVFEQKNHYFLLCEHPHVYTLGKSGKPDHLLINDEFLKNIGATFYPINRGGDITYHGPGQIVGYPILDLENFITDVHVYVRNLEQIMINVLAKYQLEGIRYKEYTGVWLGPEKGKPARKICAIGVHLSRWVTLHGFAFNVNTNLDYFNYIVPCGIVDPEKSVTTLSKELGYDLDMEEVKQQVKTEFENVFNCKLAC